MAAGTNRPNLQTGATRRHSLDRKVSDRWAHFCPSRKPVAEITMTTISTAPVIRITLRLRSASGPTLFTKMCGPRKATAPKQMKVKKGNKPVGILIMGNAANARDEARRVERFQHVTEAESRRRLDHAC